MTEEEAKTKACCGPRSESPSAAGTGLSCLGSACMAWRSQPEHGPLVDSKPLFGERPGPEWVAYYPKGETTPRDQQLWALFGPSAEAGFCGLAGPVQ